MFFIVFALLGRYILRASLENINKLQNQNLEITKRLDKLTSKYNQAIEVINNLSARIDALEANYDPTLIK